MRSLQLRIQSTTIRLTIPTAFATLFSLLALLVPANVYAQGNSTVPPFLFVLDTGAPETVDHFRAGDIVRITLQLMTSDTTTPENTEGEGCITFFFTTDTPGLPVPVLNPQPICGDYSPYFALITMPTLSLTGYDLVAQFANFDGDESANITIAVNPVEALGPSTASELAAWDAQIRKADVDAMEAKVAEALCVFLGPEPEVVLCERYFIGLEAAAEAAKLHYEELAATDPVDPNFSSLATVRRRDDILHINHIQGVDNGLIDAANDQLSNLQQQIDLLQAISTSENRASGAMAAGNIYWEHRQQQAAAEYLLQLSKITKSQIGLQAALQRAWVKAGYSNIVPTATDVHNVQLVLNTGGLSADEVSLFQREGLTAQDISTVLFDLETLDYNQVVATGGFPSILTYQPFVAELQQSAEASENLAISTFRILGHGDER